MSDILSELKVLIGADTTALTQVFGQTQGQATDWAAKITSIVGGISFAGIMTGAYKAAEAFQESANQIQRSTGAIGQRLDSLTGSMKSLYAGSSQSQSAIASVLSEVTIKTGLQGAALESLSKSWLNFAKVTGQEVTPAVQSNQKLFAEWGVTANSQKFAIDMLVAGWQRAGGTMENFTQQMLGTATTLRTVGFSFEESVALVANFTRAGLDADSIVRGLTTAMGKWAVAGEDPRAMLNGLIERMSAAKTDTDALAMAQEAGLGRSSKIMVQAVKDGAFALDAMKQKLEAARGETDKLAAATTTFGSEMSKAWHGLANLGATVGGPFVDFLTTCLKTVRELDAGFAKLEGSALGWLNNSGLLDGFKVLNNVLNPWASGNYLNNMFGGTPQPPMPKLPGAPVPADLAYGGATTNSGAGGKADVFAPLQSDAWSILIARYREAEAAHKAVIKEIADSGLSIPQFWDSLHEKVATDALAFDDLRYALIPQKSIFDSLAPIIGKCEKAMRQFGDSIDQAEQAALSQSTFGQLESGLKALGIASVEDYGKVATSAEKAYSQILNTGLATQRELAEAALKTAQAEIDLDHAMGKLSDARYEADSAAIQKDLAVWTGAEKKKQSLLEQALGETKRLTTQMFASIERGLASDIMHWTSFGKTIKNIFQRLGEDVISIMLHALLKPLETVFAKVLAGLVTKLLDFFGITQTSAAATDVAEVTGQAAVGGAGAAAAAAPFFWWNPALAVAIGAAMAGSIEGTFAPMAMFKQGGLVGEDMIAGLHADEMVLPADISKPLRSMIASQGAIGAGGGINFHGCSFNGVTRDLVKSVFGSGVRQARLAGMNA